MSDTDKQQDVQRDQGSAPVPDPTVLTTEALQREIAALKELIEQRITALREFTTEVHNGTVGVTLERFASQDKQFALVEQQRVEQKEDTKAAVDAALTAQKEAVKEQTTASERAIAKSETATTKSIEQLGDKFDTAIEGLRREVGDVKERLTGSEGQEIGARQTTSDHNITFTQIATLAAIVVAAVGVIATIVVNSLP